MWWKSFTVVGSNSTLFELKKGAEMIGVEQWFLTFGSW